jgi:uroporphyrinogen-III synthase
VSEQLKQSMAGCEVLITADRRAVELSGAFARRGATVRRAPVMSIIPSLDDPLLRATTQALVADPPDVVVATTGVGFRGWIEAADAAGQAPELIDALRGARIVARGPKARGAVQAAGLQTDWVADSETAAEIIEVLCGEGVAGLRIAVQHHGAGSDGLDEAFTEAGASVVGLVVYRWGPPPDAAALEASLRSAAAGEIDTVVFTSAPGVTAWLEAAERLGLRADALAHFGDGSMIAAAVGPVTAAPLRELGISPLVPERGRLGALVRVVVNHYDRLEQQALITTAGRLQLRANAAVLDRKVLQLTPGGLAVLRRLVRARGDVVSKAEVLAALPGGSRDEHAAEVAIARLRDASGGPGLIRTVVKRGYRLDLVEARATTSPPRDGSRN